MVTKSSSNKLLSKFAQLFREPKADDDSGSAQSAPTVASTGVEPSLKQLLKRKLRNDAIREMELNHLRTLIQDGKGFKQSSFLEAQTPSQLVRNSILDKIDGAEAHLEQWWGAATTLPPLTPPSQPAPPNPVPEPVEFGDDLDLDFTGLGAIGEPEITPPEPELHNLPAPPILLDIVVSPLDQCLRDAAQHFADGDFRVAHDLLSEMLRQPTIGRDAAETLTFTLFEVYRCTGQQDRFDALALDYATRFGRSPAEWFSLVDDSGQGVHSRLGEQPQESTWQCPAVLDLQALSDCKLRNPAKASICHINWEALQHIDSAMASELGQQLKSWSERPLELHWTGLDALLHCVQICKVSDDLADNAAWWRVHLELLRIQQRADAYEEMALDYCVAFEISPPSWQPALCRLVQDGDFKATSGFPSTLPAKDFDESMPSRTPYAVCEIQGHLTGDASHALRALRIATRKVNQITVSCGRLGRVDFDAASALISWATQTNAQGCHVQFTQLPRLVLVFLEMLGMNKVAELTASAH